LRPLKAFAQAYIDNIITSSKSFPEYLNYLRALFRLLVNYNIVIVFKKTFLGYPDINLLGRRVNSLGITTVKDKLKAISTLNYPSTLKDLEYYLNLIGYLRSSVYYYI